MYVVSGFSDGPTVRVPAPPPPPRHFAAELPVEHRLDSS